MDELIAGTKVLIPWSGGLDSTFLVNLAIEKGCKVDVCYFKIDNNTEKTQCEHNARRAMLDYFSNKARTLNQYFGDLGELFSFDVGHDHNRKPVGRFTQTPLWVVASAYCAADHDYVAMGFVMGDQTISWNREYKNLFDCYKKIRHDVEEESSTELIFPIMRTPKDYIWAQGLPYELREHIWFCESPRKIDENSFEPCGHCKPCSHHPGPVHANGPVSLDCIQDDTKAIMDVRKKAVTELSYDMKKQIETLQDSIQESEEEIYQAS
jgi:7-cyano-7-deazaguanine synthase in queuosine biosynthesis